VSEGGEGCEAVRRYIRYVVPRKIQRGEAGEEVPGR
jgi:hypothetical protein